LGKKFSGLGKRIERIGQEVQRIRQAPGWWRGYTSLVGPAQ
jgi:hypothetical protein